VQCQKCGASSCPEGIRYSQEEAITDWNTRPADPRLAELVQEHATLRYSLTELRAIAEAFNRCLRLRTDDLSRIGKYAPQNETDSIRNFADWKTRNPQ
jgi:hypothetical protein